MKEQNTMASDEVFQQRVLLEFQHLHSRLESIENRLGSVEGRLETVEQDVKELRSTTAECFESVQAQFRVLGKVLNLESLS